LIAKYAQGNLDFGLVRRDRQPHGKFLDLGRDGDLPLHLNQRLAFGSHQWVCQIEIGIPQGARPQRLPGRCRARRRQIDAPVAPAIGLLETGIGEPPPDAKAAVGGNLNCAGQLQEIVVEFVENPVAHLLLEEIDQCQTGEEEGGGDRDCGGGQQPEPQRPDGHAASAGTT
jgi:hypothetical protein